MYLHRILSPLVLATTLIVTPLAASATPPSATAHFTRASPPMPTPDDRDAAIYAHVEQQSPAAADFEGGGASIYIGGSAVSVVLLLLILIILL